VKTAPHRRRRHSRLACWYHKTRGARVCSNRWEPGLQALEDVVLSAIREDLLAPDIVEASIVRALDMRAGSVHDDAPATLRRELAAVDRELERLTALAAAGGVNRPAVLAALRTRQERRRVLSGHLDQSSRQRHRRAHAAIWRPRSGRDFRLAGVADPERPRGTASA
jgi:hypothetical protein